MLHRQLQTQRCIAVLGMHRSGTSVLMGSLRDAGVHTGLVLDDHFELNRRGLQEAPSLLYMHEQLLLDNGGCWHEPPETVVWGELHRYVRNLFIESRRTEPLWGFKDPRTLLVLDGWLNVLPQLICIGIFRHPAHVAQSLQERNGFTEEKSLQLWEFYNRRLLKLCQRAPFPIIEFHADPKVVQAGLGSIYWELGLSDSRIDSGDAFYVPSNKPSPPSPVNLPPHIETLYEDLRRIAVNYQKLDPTKTLFHSQHPPTQQLQAHSTRLFPKGKGADHYELTGIAARCDWVVLSDSTEPQCLLKQVAGCQAPRHVFLSLRSPFAALSYFWHEILPLIKEPFILITGSEDCTIPNQVDRRWRGFEPQEQQWILDLLDDPRLIRWWAENLDGHSHVKLHALPLGLLPGAGGHDVIIPVPRVPQLSTRPLRMLCGHHVREGPQWDRRRQVSELCRLHYQPWCTVQDQPLAERQFLQQMRQHAFVICVEGGGLDPSPKAWQAILQGAIPIIRSCALDSAYQQLPVAIVAEWDSTALLPSQLKQWRDAFASDFDTPEKRASVLERLSLDYWWDQIIS